MNRIKSLLFSLFIIFLPFALIANVSSVYNVHQTIYTEKNITVPVESGINQTDVSSVKYLLEQIDRANEILNEYQTTAYSTITEATNDPVGVSKVLTDVNNLIVKLPYFMVTIENVDEFSFQISASGNFTIDWGDGTIETITKTNTDDTTYSHSYSSADDYTVGLDGLATGYNANKTIAAITFKNSINKTSITGIYGRLGSIFPTIASIVPSFYFLFWGCNGITNSIPVTLFDGVSGAPVAYMFHSAFRDCTGITGTIPENLFSGLSGAPTVYMFFMTFYGCENLTGTIPPNLFSGIIGPPQDAMFYSLFAGCKGLTGSIPANLFSGISGAPKYRMFANTFENCIELTGSIPSGLFGDINGGPSTNMYSGTFKNCEGLSGSIPSGLFGTISGAPIPAIFNDTFNGCKSLTGSVPENLFGTYIGDPSPNMFWNTFKDCIGLTGIENGIWDLTQMNNNAITGIFNGMFEGCVNITSASPSLSATDPRKLYDYFTNIILGTLTPFEGCTNMTDYSVMPAAWGGGGA